MAVFAIIMGIILLLLWEHPVAFWCLFVPLAVIFVVLIIQLLTGRRGQVWRILALTAVLLTMILGVAIVVPSGDKCQHEEMSMKYYFEPEDSPSYSYMRPYCKNCDKTFKYTNFRGTLEDQSYLEAIKAHSDGEEIVGGEYYTMRVKVTLKFYYPSSAEKVRISCKAESEDGIIVYFSVEFKEEFREQVKMLETGDEITFRGRFYDEGCGFTDCELIRNDN